VAVFFRPIYSAAIYLWALLFLIFLAEISMKVWKISENPTPNFIDISPGFPKIGPGFSHSLRMGPANNPSKAKPG